MKILKFASIGFILGFLIPQCTFKASGQEDENTRNYKVSQFSKIYLQGGYKVYIKQGDVPALKVKVSDSEVFDYFDISSEDSELRVSMKKNHINFDHLTLYITIANLEKIKIEGGVKLETLGYINTDRFEIKVEGGAKIDMNLKAKEIKAVGEGGVLFDFEGIADKLEARISGAGHVDASELKAKNVTFTIEGVGTGSVYATDELWAQIEGVGKIKYRGEPRVHQNIDGIGLVSNN
jgi:hypothetical protein